MATRENSAAALTRYWIDNELAAWTLGEPHPECGAMVRVRTKWTDAADEDAYWAEGRSFLAPTVIEWGTHKILISPRDFLKQHAQRGRLLPGATLTLALELRGLALDPSVPLEIMLPFVDGQLALTAPGSISADLTISGDAAPIVGWIAGTIPFREIARGVRAGGDPLLLGAAAGIVGIDGGLRIRPAVPESLRLLCSLIEDHRFLRDTLSPTQ